MKNKSRLGKATTILIATIILFTSTALANPKYPPRQEGYLAGKKVTGSVSIDRYGGAASTSISLPNGSGSSVSVNLTYWYTNLETGKNQPIHKSNGGNYGAQVSVSRPVTNPDMYRSWRSEGAHTVRYSGQTWNSNTEIYY